MIQKLQITEKVLPDYPPNFIANTIEIHDQLGMLVKIVNQKITAQSSRKKITFPNLSAGISMEKKPKISAVCIPIKVYW